MDLPTSAFKVAIKSGKPQIGILSMLARGADALAAKFRSA